MAEPFERPGPYVPLALNFTSGRTGTALLEEFGPAGLGVWAALLVAAGVGNKGMVTFLHERDWAAIGLDEHPPDFELMTFLTFLGRRKQTRKTRQGRNIYVEITQWERWNKMKERELARRRNARYRRKSERNTERNGTVTSSVTPASRHRHPEVELEQESKPKAVDLVPTREPEWPAADEEQPWDLNVPEVELKEMPA